MPRPALLSTRLLFTILTTTTTLINGLRYDAKEADWNLNTNRTARTALDYWGERDASHTYKESPKNWRVPFYTLFLDRWVNGDPTNDNANGTLFETDMMSTQLRFGGDLDGLGIKVIYIAGSPFINQPWGADSYSVGWLVRPFSALLTCSSAHRLDPP
jgi:alpha-1,3-glucan synthase